MRLFNCYLCNELDCLAFDSNLLKLLKEENVITDECFLCSRCEEMLLEHIMAYIDKNHRYKEIELRQKP